MASNNDKQNFDETVIDPQSTASSESATSTSGQSHQDTGAITKLKTSILSKSGLLPTAETSNNDEQTLQRLFHCISDAIREGIQSKQDNRPNYRGIEKPKINNFDGDASQYQHWKSMFQLIYTEDRNLPESYLATMLFGLLDGEAKRAVEIHITAKWDGTNYQEMWKQLDLRYGTKHVQARCIRDKANQIPYLDTLTLKTALAFYEGVTVQVNHHLVEQPHAVQDNNSHLFQFLKEKMSDNLIDKYIEYLDSETHETPLARTVLTLQYWLERQISRLQEVEITSNTSKTRSSQNPPQQITTGYVDNKNFDNVENKLDYDSDENPDHSIVVSYNIKKNKVYRTTPVQELRLLSLFDRNISSDRKPIACSKGEEPLHKTSTCTADAKDVGLQTVVCTISARQGRKGNRVITLLDNGSTRTFIDKDSAIKHKLKRTSKEQTMQVNYLDRQVNIDTYSVVFFLKSYDGSIVQTINAYTVKDLAKHIPVIDWSKEKHKFSHLQTVPFESHPQANSINLLIGSDYLSLHKTIITKSGTADQPIARLTPLGWTCSGSSN